MGVNPHQLHQGMAASSTLMDVEVIAALGLLQIANALIEHWRLNEC
jgi:hypothetical protein